MNGFNCWLIVCHCRILGEDILMNAMSFFGPAVCFFCFNSPPCPHLHFLTHTHFFFSAQKTLYSSKILFSSQCISAENTLLIQICMELFFWLKTQLTYSVFFLVFFNFYLLQTFLAAVLSSSKDNADLGKQPFPPTAYWLRWRGSRDHNWWHIISSKQATRLVIRFNAGSGCWRVYVHVLMRTDDKKSTSSSSYG